MSIMTLEDFFTLTEMKDGLTAPARVEELVAVMKKEKDSFVKNAGDATRQWASVASTIAATENKECLDLFIKLDGLWFIDRWLKEAQTFSTEPSDCFVEEAIWALLQAVEKLQVNKERLIPSGICITIKSLFSYRSTRIQEKARSLFDSWKAKDVDVEKAAVANDPKSNNKHPESQSTADDVLTARSLGDQKLECFEGGKIKTSNDQGSPQITSDDADCKDGCPAIVASPVKLEAVECDLSVREQVCPSDVKLDPQCPSDPKQGTSGVMSEVLKSEVAAEDGRHDKKVESFPDRLGRTEASSASGGAVDSRDTSSRSEAGDAEDKVAKPDVCTNDADDDLSVKTTCVNDSNNGLYDTSPERKALDQSDGCSAMEETKDPGSTIGGYDEAKSHHRKSERKYFGNPCGFLTLTKNSRSVDIVRQTPDMDLEDGTVDALEVARLVAKEVEREVVGYDDDDDDQSGSSSSSSDNRISRGGIRQPDSPESVSGEQDPHQPVEDDQTNESPTREKASSKKEQPVINSTNLDNNRLKNHMQDTESSQVTDAVREPGTNNTDKSFCEFDLNQEVSSEERDHHHQVGAISNHPVSIVSASRAVMAPGMPAAPLQFEGTLGWKGSAATSAFRPASPRRASDSDNNRAALSGGATSSGSRQRLDFLDIDLNVAEGGDDKIITHPVVFAKQKPMLAGLPSGESSVELSPKRSERLNFDLNQIGEDADVPASPASSSSCMVQPTRNFDLNDNPSNCHDLPDQQQKQPPFFLGESSSRTLNPYLGPAPDDSEISILGTKVRKNAFPSQTPAPFPNGFGGPPGPVIDAAGLLRGGGLMGLGPPVPYAQSVYGYNGLAMGPAVSFSSGPMYGPGGPIPYMFDSRGGVIGPQIMGPASSVPSSSYCQPSLVMNMMGTIVPGSNSSVALRPSLDLNNSAGYVAAIEGGQGQGQGHHPRDPAFFRQLFMPASQGRPLEEQLRDNFMRPLSSSGAPPGGGGKRKEPDTGWELFPSNYKHHQPPHL